MFGGRHTLAAALVLAAIVSFAGIGCHSLWTPDEPTGAAVGRAMLRSGDYFVPRLNGSPFLEKPPLYWWVQAAGFRVLGVDDATARVPSALFAFLTFALTYALAWRLAGGRAGLIAVAVLATTVEFSEDMGRVVVDPALVCFVTLAYLGFVIAIEPRSPRDGRLGTVLIAAALPLAFLAKGVVGPGLALAPPLLYLCAAQRFKVRPIVRLLWPLAVTGPLLFALLVIPWVVGLYHNGGWVALRECLVGNTVGRFFGTEAGLIYGHRQPPWYYLGVGPTATLPWVLVVPALFRAGAWRDASVSDGTATPSGSPDGLAVRRLLLASCAIGVLLLSVAASKRSLYLVPLLPAFSAVVAWWMAGLDRRATTPSARAWDRATVFLLLGVASVLPLAVFLLMAALRGRAFPPQSVSPLAPLSTVLTPERIWIVGLAAAFAFVVLGSRLLVHLRAGTMPSVGWIVAPYLAMFLAYQTAGKAVIDPLKDLHDLTAAIGRLSPGDAPVWVYLPGESVIAIVNFDLGRIVRPLNRPEEIASLFARDPAAHVVVAVGIARQLPTSIAAHLAFPYDETGAKASPFAIGTWRP